MTACVAATYLAVAAAAAARHIFILCSTHARRKKRAKAVRSTVGAASAALRKPECQAASQLTRQACSRQTDLDDE